MVQLALLAPDKVSSRQDFALPAGQDPPPVTVGCPATVAGFRPVPVRPRDDVLVGLDLLELTGVFLPTTFVDLGVPADLIAVLQRSGISIPFPIQEATIP